MMKQSFEILDSFTASIAIVGADGKIIFTNSSWQQFAIENNGIPEKTGPGINYLELCRKVNGEELQNAAEAAIGIEKVIKRKRDIFEMEYPCHSIDEQRWFILRCTPLKGESELTVLSHINITQRKLAEENVEKRYNQLKEINSRLHTTMFKIVHDIQSPLNSIEGLINISKAENNNQSVGPYFSLIEKSILNLKGFVQETLQLSAATLKTEPVYFKTIVNNFYESIKYSEAVKHVEITKSIDQMSEFYTYKIEIISVISNIFSNCLKYYDKEKEKSFISVSIKTNELEAVISVKDNGIGIGKEALPSIFDLNFQVNKNANDGSGIGLNLVKKSIEFMNGTIRVNSELGAGTEFIFTIPNLKEFKN